MELASVLEETFQCEVPLSVILKNADIVCLARAVQSLSPTTTPKELDVCTSDTLNHSKGPISYVQECMCAMQLLEPESDDLVISVAGYSRKCINTEKLNEAAKALVRRHPSLRIVFHLPPCAAPSQEVLDINSSKLLKLVDSAVLTIDCSKI